MSVGADTAPPVAHRPTGTDTRPILQRLTRAPSWLPLTAIVAVAFGVTAIWVRSIHTFGVMPDEITYVKQALEIARTGMLVGPHDFYWGSWNQLLPLITAPVFGALGMVDAFYAVHTLLALVLASTAVPTYLIARSLGLGRLAANLAAALSVAVPWMLLAGVVMTEDVAYPAFAWAMLAFLRAMQQPSPRRDLLALAGLGLVCFARTQFVFLGPVLVASVLIHDLRMGLEHPAASAAAGAALVAGVRRTLVVHWLLWTVSAVALGRDHRRPVGRLLHVPAGQLRKRRPGQPDPARHRGRRPRAARHHGDRGRHRAPGADGCLDVCDPAAPARIRDATPSPSCCSSPCRRLDS